MLNHLYNLPEEKRRGIALLGAGAASAIIVGAWFVGFLQPISGARVSDGNSVGEHRASIQETLSPFRTLSESFSALTKDVREKLGGALWGIEELDDKKKNAGAEDETSSGGTTVWSKKSAFDAPMSSSTPEDPGEGIEIDEHTKNENADGENEEE